MEVIWPIPHKRRRRPLVHERTRMASHGNSCASLERTSVTQINISALAIVLLVIFFLVIILIFAVFMNMLRFTAVAESVEHRPHYSVTLKSHGLKAAVLVAHGPCSLRTCHQTGIRACVPQPRRRRTVGGGASFKSNIGPPGLVGRSGG